MSTILDALKKVEDERPQSPRERLLHVASPESPRRRPLSLGVIATCAVLGFAAGIGLALWRNAPPFEVAMSPEPAPPPAIDVPVPPPVAPADRVGAPLPAPPVAAAAGTEPEAAAVAEATAALQLPAAPDAPGGAAPRSGAEVETPTVVAQAPAAGSALEPSPFARAGTARAEVENVDPGAPGAPSRTAPPAPEPAADRLAALPSEAGPAGAPDEIAALGEPTAPVPEPPPAPPELIDTGRSPPGAPKVVLSFLQWSTEPARRFALVSIDGAPSQRVREGDAAAGMTVAQITPTGVQFSREGKLFMIRTRH